MRIVPRRFGKTCLTVMNGRCVAVPLNAEFTEALAQLTKERGGGYIDIATVRERAAQLQVVDGVKLPPPPPVVAIVALPAPVKKLPPP